MSVDAQAANPYPGLRPFRADEEHLFFGRDDQVDAMIDKLAQTRLLAVVGSSGSGKSSLVSCGLIPGLYRGQLAHAGCAWRVAVLRPGHSPMHALAEVLCRPDMLAPAQPPPAGCAAADLMLATLSMSTLGLVDACQQAGLAPGQNLLVVVDQFEELFRYQALDAASPQAAPTLHTDEQAAAFVKLLLAAAAQAALPIWIVLTMRSDFLGECAQFLGLPEAVNQGQYLVPRMSRDERRAAIAEPLRVTGTPCDPALITRLVNDVGDNPDQLSILQHALNRTWACWQDAGGSGELTLGHYQKAGTMITALDLHAEQAYRLLQPGRQQAVAEALFRAITDRVTDSRGTRRPTRLDKLVEITQASAEELTAVIEVFRDPQRSFLMPPAGTALQCDSPIDISHESLMRVWDRLRRWGQAEAQSAQTYLRLGQTAELHRSGQLGLLRQPDLQFYVGWRQREHPNPAWAGRYLAGFVDTMEFLLRSEQAERQRLWRMRAMTGAAVVVPMVVAFSMAFLYEQAKNARRTAEAALTAADAERNSARKAEGRAQARLLETRAAQAQSETSRSQAEDLLAFLIGERFLDQLRPVGRSDILDAVQVQVDHYLQQAEGSDGQRPSALRAQGLALRNAGDLKLAQGKLGEAVRRFTQSAEVFGRLAAASPDPAVPVQAQAEQARSLARLGDAQIDLGQSAAALVTHRQALALRQVIFNTTPGVDARIELSLSHSAVGRALNELGRPRDALQALDGALALLGPLPTALATPKLSKALIDAHENRADALAGLDDAPAQRQALAAAGRFTDDWRQRHPLSSDARQREVLAATFRANEKIAQGSQREALDIYLHIEALMDELVHWDGSNAPWQRDLQALRMLKAQVQKDLGNPDQARLTLSQVLPALQKLTTTDPSDLNRLRDLGWLHKDRGMLAASQGRWAEALPDLAQAERLYATAATGAPANLRWHQDWYWSIYALAQVQRDAGHPAQALVQLHKGRNLIDRLLRDAPQWTPLVQHRIRYFDAMALQLLNQPGDAKQADALLRQMQAVLDRALATARPAGPMLLVAAADVDSLRADRADTDGRTNDALALRRSSLAKARSAVDRDPADPLWWDYLAERAGALARQHANLARWTEAAAAYRDEIRPRERALELAPQQLMANIARVPATEDQKNQILQPRLPGQADTANQAPALAPALGSRANLLHVAQINLGDALEHADQPKPALQAYADALRSIDQAVALNEREAVYLHNRRNAWRRIAKLQAGLGNIQAALAAYEAAQPPGRLAFDRAVSAEDRASQANWLYLLTLEQGDLRAMQQGPNAATEAVAAYKNALPWIEKAAELVPKASLYQNNLAALYRRIATQQRNLKQGEQEIAALNKGLAAADLAARLAGPPDTAAEQASRHVERMHAYNEFADWQQRQGASAQALLARRTALAAIAQAGKLEPDRASHQDALGTAQRTIAQQESSPAAAGTAWRAAAAAALQAAALAASATRFNQAAQDLYGLGNHLNLQDDLAPALQAYQQAIQQLQRAMGADDQPDKHQRGMSVCQRMVAQTLKKLPGRSAEAGPALEAAVAAGSKATAWERDNIHAWQALYRARQELGLHLELAGQRAQGLAQLEQALHEAEQARKLDGGNGSVSTDIDELRLALAQRRPR